MFRRLGLLAVAFLLATPIACSHLEDETGDGQDRFQIQMAQTLKVGAYFVDGTNNHPEQNSIIHQLSNQTNVAVVTSSVYFDGPDLAGLECLAITESVVRTICDDIQANRTNVWTVFGFSRGAFIANKAASLALRRCGRAPLPLPRNGSSSNLTLLNQYLYGGFVDAVAMSLYLQDANWVPEKTLFDHLHRKDIESTTIMPVTMFGGGIGVNEVGADLEHIAMGFSEEVLKKVKAEANKRTGMRIF